ncbi:MAG: hypothetical protein U5K51_12975 [Flavobacteriaceae bacterium]|nr:hypothetical protein [Flavobacteriaceae bacterium]
MKHIKWWSPDPSKIVIDIPNFDFLGDQLLYQNFKTTFNRDFTGVVNNCKEIYNKKEAMDNRWLTERLDRIFHELHEQGYAHSVEVWQENNIVAGLIGIALGKMFFVECLYSTVKNADIFALES